MPANFEAQQQDGKIFTEPVLLKNVFILRKERKKKKKRPRYSPEIPGELNSSREGHQDLNVSPVKQGCFCKTSTLEIKGVLPQDVQAAGRPPAAAARRGEGRRGPPLGRRQPGMPLPSPNPSRRPGRAGGISLPYTGTGSRTDLVLELQRGLLAHGLVEALLAAGGKREGEVAVQGGGELGGDGRRQQQRQTTQQQTGPRHRHHRGAACAQHAKKGAGLRMRCGDPAGKAGPVSHGPRCLKRGKARVAGGTFVEREAGCLERGL